MLVSVVVGHPGKMDLLQIVLARSSARGFPCRLNRRQKQSDQDANDRDDNEQLHESERRELRSRGTAAWLIGSAVMHHRHSPANLVDIHNMPLLCSAKTTG
jgi:hypothetical protein